VQALLSRVLVRERGSSAPFLFYIDHCFAIKGQGTVVTGGCLSQACLPNCLLVGVPGPRDGDGGKGGVEEAYALRCAAPGQAYLAAQASLVSLGYVLPARQGVLPPSNCITKQHQGKEACRMQAWAGPSKPRSSPQARPEPRGAPRRRSTTRRPPAGTVARGSLRVNDPLELPELKLVKKVRSMQMFRRPVAACQEGDRVGICLTQLDPKLIERGMACAPGGGQGSGAA
jgi:hypothetical protein